MNKQRYIKPETQIEEQVHIETPLLAGSNEYSDIGKNSVLTDGLPTFGAAIDNPSFVRKSDGSNSVLWDDEEE